MSAGLICRLGHTKPRHERDGSLKTSSFPVTDSTPSPHALVTEVLSAYAIEPVIECRFLHKTVNDTFLVLTTGPKYILRVYRAGVRAASDVQYELEALCHLHHERVAVSVPLARRRGGFIGTIPAPEGVRLVVLFTFAPGVEMKMDAAEDRQVVAYGRAAAQIDAAGDDFRPDVHRAVDVNQLLVRPLELIEPLIRGRAEDWKYLQALAGRLRNWLEELPDGHLEIGFCHGDLHGGNAHFDEQAGVTFFDFDCSGDGWRAYELAVFRWSARLRGKEKEYWPLFLSGYQEVKSIGNRDIEATVNFIAVRHFWLLGLHAALPTIMAPVGWAMRTSTGR